MAFAPPDVRSAPRRGLAALGAAMLGLAVLAGGTAPAAAQPLLYEQRLPEGSGFVRFANATGSPITIKPDFDDEITVGANGAERVTPYYVEEGIAGRPVRLQITIGGRTGNVEVRLNGAALNVILIQGQGEAVTATAFQVRQLYEQQRAVLTFFNAVPDCPNGTLALAPSGQAVLSNVGPASAQNRAVAAAAAVVRASCGSTRAADLDLGRLQAGQLYSVWLIAPGGTPTAFLARDTIARR